MSYGIEVVLNEDDQIVLDGVTPILRAYTMSSAVRSSVPRPSGTNSNNWGPSYPNTVHLYKVPVGSPSKQPLVLIKWPVGLELFSMGKTGNDMYIYAPMGDGPSNLEYALCDFSTPGNPVSGYGAVIYDENGTVVFSSEGNNAKVKHLAPNGPTSTYSGNPPVASYQNVVFPNIANLYFSLPYLWDTGGFVNQGFNLGGVKRISNTQLQRVSMVDTQTVDIFGNPGVMIATL